MNAEYLSYLGSITTRDARFTQDIKSRIVMGRAAIGKETDLFTSKLDIV
jgi:hypothetical protein